ncbi:hypothetical protein EYF80_014998 [Liparis tanakae]|uniref:UPAR/Ly6 domain-containing protein n=1 Tax=Liparis tanakae TaxID=230148 RepID=A0A4Z2I9Y1_9TELE|nr:hypothetical protein EYF80_014998 [Liparis tanakae]
MMKLGLTLALIWMLSSADGALECQVSRGSETCASDEYCATAAMRSNNITHQVKSCESSSMCKPNNQTLSFNFGDYTTTALIHCCKTNNCNSEDVTYPDVQIKNSLQCFTCGNDAACDKTVQCVGVQTRCFKGYVEANNTFPSLGCASPNLCTLLQLNKTSALIGHINFTRPECCGTSFCNSAGIVNLSVAPMLLVLLFLIVY